MERTKEEVLADLAAKMRNRPPATPTPGQSSPGESPPKEATPAQTKPAPEDKPKQRAPRKKETAPRQRKVDYPPRFCDKCGLEYLPISKTQRYCDNCRRCIPPERTKGDKSGIVICVTCGKEFEAKNTEQAKYCSKTCAQKKYNKAERDKHEPVSDNQKLVWVQCVNPECPNGNKFQTTWQKYRSGAKFCDIHCRDTYKRLNSKKFQREQEEKRHRPPEQVVQIDYEPHSGGQQIVHDSLARFKVLICGARWGKDRCLINEFIVKFAQMLSEKRPTTLIPRVHGWLVAPTYPLAKQIWRELVHFWPVQWRVNKNEAEHRLETVAGGLIEVKSADNPDSLVSVGLDAVLVTEAARIKDMETTWSYLRGRLSSPGRGPDGTGGIAMINSCVTADTLVFTEKGLFEIGEISSAREPGQYDDCGLSVVGFYGDPQTATHFYCNGFSETLKITTCAGYQLEGTHNHPVWAMDENGNPEWKQLDELRTGDYVAIRRGMDYWGSDHDISGFTYNNKRQRPSDHGEDVDLSEMTPDLAYLMGLILGDGYVDYKQGKISIAHSDSEKETIDFLLSQPHKIQFYHKIKQHTEACSKKLTAFLEWYGFKPGVKAKCKTIPSRLFSAPKWVVANFLSGLFDADGHARDRKGIVGLTSASFKLVKQVQTLLLNFGIVSRITHLIIAPTKKVKVESEVWQLHLSPRDSAIFYEQIGFRLSRKQDRRNLFKPNGHQNSSSDGIPNQATRISRIFRGAWFKKQKTPGLYVLKKQKTIGYAILRTFLDALHMSDARDDMQVLEKLYQENYYWDKIKTIESGQADTFDFVIPNTHAFVSNGFISHNTPKGRNYLYKMFMWGKDERFPEWESFQFPTSSNPYIHPKEVEEAKRTLPDRLFRQEYLGEFLEDSGEVFPNVDEISKGAPQEPVPGMTYKAAWDPAQRNDYSAFGIRNERGEQVLRERWTGMPWTLQLDRVEYLCKRYNNAHLDIDSTGLGETLPEAAAQRGLSVTGHFFSNPFKEQIVSHFGILCETREILLLDDEAQREELKAYTYTFTKTGKVSYHHPVGGHDDLVTMLMLLYMDFNTISQVMPFVGLLMGSRRSGTTNLPMTQ